MIVKVICGWCRKDFDTENDRGKSGEFLVRICSNCGRLVKSSRIEPTGNVVGKKHIHSQSRSGDVV